MTQDCNPRNRPEYNDNFRPDLEENQKYFGVRNEVQDLRWGVGRGSEERWIGTGLGITNFLFSLLVECDRLAIFIYDFCAVFVFEFKTKITVV